MLLISVSWAPWSISRFHTIPSFPMAAPQPFPTLNKNRNKNKKVLFYILKDSAAPEPNYSMQNKLLPIMRDKSCHVPVQEVEGNKKRHFLWDSYWALISHIRLGLQTSPGRGRYYLLPELFLKPSPHRVRKKTSDLQQSHNYKTADGSWATLPLSDAEISLNCVLKP